MNEHVKKGVATRQKTDRLSKLKRMNAAELRFKIDVGENDPLADINRCIDLKRRMRRPNYTIMENGVITEVEYKENGQYVY